MGYKTQLEVIIYTLLVNGLNGLKFIFM